LDSLKNTKHDSPYISFQFEVYIVEKHFPGAKKPLTEGGLSGLFNSVCRQKLIFFACRFVFLIQIIRRYLCHVHLKKLRGSMKIFNFERKIPLGIAGHMTLYWENNIDARKRSF